MIEGLLVAIVVGVCTGIVGFVYVNILCAMPGQLLSPIYEKATEYAHKHPKAEYWLRPIILCAYCVSGQMAIWCYLYLVIRMHIHYIFPVHLFSAVVAILIVHILQQNDRD